MPLLSLSCNHCGAPLEVPPETRFLTCRFCSSQLEVQHAGGAVYTHVLEALDQRTAEMSKDLQAIKRQNELEQLDRDWLREREQYLVHGKGGRTSVPTVATSLLGMFLGVGFGLFWTAFTFAQHVPILPVFGVVFIGVTIIGMTGNIQKAQKHQTRQAEYEARRQQLIEKSNS